jgi:hypothetical protein
MQEQGPVDHLPALRSRRAQSINGPLDQARRLLWRAFQHGELSEDEFARTLERLEPPTDAEG